MAAVSKCLCLATIVWLVAALCGDARAAEELRLREGISFYQDLDAGFPIIGQKMDDVAPAADRPTFIFFGAAGDLNTNRQARRVVELYRKYRDSALKFVVLDVDQPASDQAKQLIREHYRGYIPCEVILDSAGQKKWSHTGEIEERLIQTQLDKVLAGNS